LLIGKEVIEPKLEQVTNGRLSERYSNTQSSGRDVFAMSELSMFASHPVLGVGPGVGTQIRTAEGMIGGASHTEYTRMLGEHGLLGALAFVALLVLAVRAIRSHAHTLALRATSGALLTWVAVFLAIYGTRVMAPAFVFGLAFARKSKPNP
jgi:O-antigen ligase